MTSIQNEPARNDQDVGQTHLELLVRDGHYAQLPNVDRGKDAYLFLFACAILESLIWGKLA